MMDPYFFEDDQDFSDMTEDDLGDAAEEYVYDTYDQIIDENDLEESPMSDMTEDDLDGISSGAAFAFADMMRSEERYDVDENTDQENWDKAMSRAPLSSRHESTKLRPFEQYVQNYIKRGFRHPDD